MPVIVQITTAMPVIVQITTASATPVIATVSPARDAYQLALADGFVGTRLEWEASLVGPQGIQGETGATGATGPQGVAGTGKEWVDITVVAYNALTTEQKNDTTKVYNLTDFVW